MDIPKVPVPDFVTEHFLSYGDKVCTVDFATKRSYTYTDYLARISTVAKLMSMKGVKEGTVVNIHSPNLIDYGVLVAAITSLGAVVSPSNPLYQPRELAHQLRDAKCSFVITIPMFKESVMAAAKEVDGAIKDVWVIGEDSGNWIFAPAKDKPTGPIKSVDMDPSEHLFALPYSSGTTGLPKGVMLTHTNLVANVQQCVASAEHNVGINKDSAVISLLPLFHIYGKMFNLTTQRVGATSVVLQKFDPMQFLQAMQDHKITFAPLVPPIINFLARHPVVSKFDLSSLQTVFSGAAPLDAETQHLLEKRFPHAKVLQGFGMTESSPVTHVPIRDKAVTGSVGRVVPNGEYKIVDEHDTMLAAGPDHVGELCFRGPNVMRGYVNNPTATASTIKNGWLHTGDLAYRNEAGDVFLVDRLKELIKVKGLQVAPAELEGLLLQHPAVADCAVVGTPDERSGEVPVAFVVRKSDEASQSTSDDDIKAFVASKVAEYKQIAKIVAAQEIPKSAAGKILRRVLKEQLKQHQGQHAHHAPKH